MRSLGGEVVITAGSDVAASVVHVARQRNATQIVAGKPTALQWWQLGRRRTLVNDLIRTSGDIDIYVVSGEDEATAPIRFSLPTNPEPSIKIWLHILRTGNRFFQRSVL